MNNLRGLLYPAMHKFYSALSSLEKFEKGSNFFDNITYLDNFFSEYRNITFVLQKSVAHTEYKSLYESLRDKYLVNEVCTWFLNKRNEVLKQQPFDLEKNIKITIYSDEETLSLPEYTFTIEDDVEYSTLIDSLQNTFKEINGYEIMFSAEFSFHEQGYTDDLYTNFISGIDHMKEFMAAMRKSVNEECKLCDELEKKINDFNFHRIPKNMLLTDDYIYYTIENRFEKASRVEFSTPMPTARMPISGLEKIFPSKGSDLFNGFVMMHLVVFQMQKQLMPTCFIFYNDATFRMMSFDSSLRTTIYRKLFEIAGQIKSDGIIDIYYVTQMIGRKIDSESSKSGSSSNVKQPLDQLLAFFKRGKNSDPLTYYFDTTKCSDPNYVAEVMSVKSEASESELFLNAIQHAFKE